MATSAVHMSGAEGPALPLGIHVKTGNLTGRGAVAELARGPKRIAAGKNSKGSPSLTIGCFIASCVWDVDLFGSFVVLTASKQSCHWFGLFLHRCWKPQVQSGHRDVQEQLCGRERQVRLSF